MAAHFETYLTEKQALFVRTTLEQAIDSMNALFLGLHRENERFHSLEVDAILAKNQAEIAALRHMVIELLKFEAAHGWLEAPLKVETTPAECNEKNDSAEKSEAA